MADLLRLPARGNASKRPHYSLHRSEQPTRNGNATRRGNNPSELETQFDTDDDSMEIQSRPTMASPGTNETPRPSPGHRRKRRRAPSPRTRSLRSAVLAAALLLLSPCLLSTLLHHRASFLSSGGTLRMSPFSNFQIHVAEAKEIVATREWQLLGENDTIPAGLHVRMDLSTGEKWVKLASDEAGDEDIKAAAHDGGSSDGGGEKVEEVEMDASGALSIIETGDDAEREGAVNDATTNDGNENESGGGAGSDIPKEGTGKDYEMMHRVMSRLPPQELERFGGLPALPASNATPSGMPAVAQLTPEQREAFERRMDEIWRSRQEELARLQEDVADLPSMLKDRIATIEDYLKDVEGSLKLMVEDRKLARGMDDEGADDEENMVNDIVDALRDLEFQLADVDMARDFHTLGGWPRLVALLDDSTHSIDAEDEDSAIIVDEVRALAAMTVGTAVGNLGEFRGWALEDVSTGVGTSSALSLLLRSFDDGLELRSKLMAGGSMAVPAPISDARYKSRATYRLRAVYALGALLRGNPAAQLYFVSREGPETLARDALGTLSSVRGPEANGNKALARLDYKFASKVLALGEDVVMGAVLNEEEEDGVKENSLLANQLVAAFTTERWCDLALRMLAPPSEVIGAVASRGIKERALSAVRVLAPGCQRAGSEGEDAASSSWGTEEVRRVRSEWNREGSDDGLDSVYRRELLDLADGVLEVLN